LISSATGGCAATSSIGDAGSADDDTVVDAIGDAATSSIGAGDAVGAAVLDAVGAGDAVGAAGGDADDSDGAAGGDSGVRGVSIRSFSAGAPT
jgi:hypothetical protein